MRRDDGSDVVEGDHDFAVANHVTDGRADLLVVGLGPSRLSIERAQLAREEAYLTLERADLRIQHAHHVVEFCACVHLSA